MNDLYDPNKPQDSSAVNIPSVWIDYGSGYKLMTYTSIESGELDRLYEIERKYKTLRDLLHKIIDEAIDIASDNNDK